MTREEFDTELARVQAVLPPPRGDEVTRRACFADELYLAMASERPEVFHDVVTEVIRTHGAQRWFAMREFTAALAKVQASRPKERPVQPDTSYFDRSTEIDKQKTLAAGLTKEAAINCLNAAEDRGKPFAPEVEEILVAVATSEKWA